MESHSCSVLERLFTTAESSFELFLFLQGGVTPFQISCREGRENIAEILKEAKVDQGRGEQVLGNVRFFEAPWSW